MSNIIEMTDRVMAAIEDATSVTLVNASRIDDNGDCVIEFVCDDMRVGPINMGAFTEADIQRKEELVTKMLVSEAMKYTLGASITMTIDGKEFYITEEQQQKVIEHASNGGTVDAEYMAALLAA